MWGGVGSAGFHHSMVVGVAFDDTALEEGSEPSSLPRGAASRVGRSRGLRGVSRYLGDEVLIGLIPRDLRNGRAHPRPLYNNLSKWMVVVVVLMMPSPSPTKAASGSN